MKKILSLLLIAVMFCSIFSPLVVSVFAESEKEHLFYIAALSPEEQKRIEESELKQKKRREEEEKAAEPVREKLTQGLQPGKRFSDEELAKTRESDGEISGSLASVFSGSALWLIIGMAVVVIIAAAVIVVVKKNKNPVTENDVSIEHDEEDEE